MPSMAAGAPPASGGLSAAGSWYRCVWKWGMAEQRSTGAAVVNGDGRILHADSAQAGCVSAGTCHVVMLACRLAGPRRAAHV